MDVAMRRHQEGALIDVPKPVYHKFDDYAAHFWDWDTCPVIQDRVRRGGHYSAESARTNAKVTAKHITPYFSGILIESITPRMIEDWILKLPGEKKLSNKTCNNLLTVFRQILDSAVADGLIERNPAKLVKPLIKDNKKRRGCFTVKQIQELFKADWQHEQVRVMCYLASRTGMRLGEVQALTPAQLHEGYIEVNASWADYEGRKTTKSGYGRIVPIDAATERMLREICPPDPEDLFFTLDGKQPLSSTTIGKYLRLAMTAAKIDYKTAGLSFHSFRHFMNTRLKAASIDGEMVRAVIGHESAEMTEHYLHLGPQDMECIRAVQRGLAM
jgi:integrase